MQDFIQFQYNWIKLLLTMWYHDTAICLLLVVPVAAFIEFTQMPLSQAVVFGHNVVLNCEAVTDQPGTLTYTWYHNGTQLTASVFSNHSLLIVDVQQSKLGNYSCHVTSSNSSETSILSSAVLIQAYISNFVNNPSQVTVTEGETAILECVTGESAPPPQVYWEKDGQQVTSGSQFKARFGTHSYDMIGQYYMKLILESKPRETGLYSCVAVNTALKALYKSLVVQVKISAIETKPYIDVDITQNATVMAPEGFELVLNCAIGGFPKPIITWYKLQDVIVPDSRVRVLTNGSLEFVLLIQDDQGYYFCQGSNFLGHVRTQDVFVQVSLLVAVEAQYCPSSWDKVYRSYSRFGICVKRLPRVVTWQEGEQMCKDLIGTPLAWNESLLYEPQSQGTFTFTENEIWSSLVLKYMKLFHSGAPMTSIGLSPFNTPYSQSIDIQWDADQPTLNSGECVSINSNKTAQFSYCSEQKFMYCQRYRVKPTVSQISRFCPDGFIGNIYWESCYKFMNEPSTFFEAKASCESRGATLVNVPESILINKTSSDYRFLVAAEEYYYNIFFRNTEINWMNFWYKDQLADSNTCDKIAYTDGGTFSSTEDCNTKLPYMCEMKGKVETDKQMFISISVIPWRDDRIMHTLCNLSRPLLPGENIYISINYRPISRDRIIALDDTGLQYLGDLSSIYQRVVRNGIHLCEVTGLHNKQKWSAEFLYQEPVTKSIWFMGSIDYSPSMPPTEIVKYNLATEPELRQQKELTSPTDYLNQEWMNIVQSFGESSTGYYSTRVVGFSDSGNSMNFEIMLQLLKPYSMALEQVIIFDLRERIVQYFQLTRRRREVSNFGFVPSSLIIQSTQICGGKVFIPDLGTTVNFLPVKFGLIAISSEICITDKQPLATSSCVGGIGITTKFVDIQVNQKCLFGDLSTSAVTDTLRNLTEVNIDENTVNKVLETVKNLTSDPTPLTSIDIINTAEILVKASNVSNLNERALTDSLDTINSVLSVEPETIKLAQEDGSATNRLLEVINTIPRFLDLQGQPGIRWVRENILMEVYDISALSSTIFGIQIEGGSFPVALTNSTIQNLINGSNVNLETVDAAIILPVELINKFPNATRISFNIYRNWNLFSVRSDVRQYLPNSRVIASSIFIDGIPVRSLGEYEVQTLFYPTADVESSVCGYWNYDLYDTSGGWATDGCQLNKTEYGRYVCVCDHLTNFAVIVNIGGQDNLVESLAMDIISWIGLILSIIGLSLTIVSFIVFKHLRKGRAQQTLFNLALSLLCFLIIFIVGIGQTQDLKGCIAVAVLLHYFILVAFMWMLMEGILQYLRFVKVLGTYIPNFILKTAVPAWGIPLIPVIIVLAYDHELYIGGNKACWMSLSAFYYAFIIPVGVIILANIIIFIMILKNLWGRSKGLKSNQSEKKRAMMNLRASLTVLVLLGLTWIFGFFTIEKASIVFQYIFTILNVLQGFIIFILFTAREKRVRQNWQKLCCKRTTKEKYLQSDTNTDRNRSKDRILTSSTNDDTKFTGEDQNTSSCI